MVSKRWIVVKYIVVCLYNHLKPKMNQPLVSILIPYKNTAIYLKECLDSIIAQDYADWEVIAINDHSTDTSYDLVNTYAQKEPRIKTFINSGRGIIKALRTAYEKSAGTLITRMDSDDLMNPNRISHMAKDLIDMGKGHLSVGQVRYFSERGISNGYARYEHWLNSLTLTGTNFTELYKECVIPSPCWMAHRSDLDACGAFEPNRYPEDYDLAFRFYAFGLNIIPCKEVLLLWRDYDSRTSRTSELYAQNYFLDIKLHYFLKLHLDKNRPLVVWGAGAKGKQIAQMLNDVTQGFTWICDNPKKIGKEIYGNIIQPFQQLRNMGDFQAIITVANENEQKDIIAFLTGLKKEPMQDYYFFC